MEELLKKLYIRGQKRIAVIEAPESFYIQLEGAIPEVQTDKNIDPRFLYDFILAFVTKQADITSISPRAIHNLSPDGKLWFAFPKVGTKDQKSDISRNKGWDMLDQAGFGRVSQISFNESWSALRFRNKKYIKSKNREV